MSFSYQQFVDFVEQSELMAVISAEKKKVILERYKDFDGEQLEEAIETIKKHEVRWNQARIDNQKKLEDAEKNLNEALQSVRGRAIEDIHEKESKERESEEDILNSLEDQLNNI